MRFCSVTSAISCVELSVGYGALAAVRAATIEVHHGEVVALLGPNGAGKSTLLRAIAGVLRPIAGTVLLEGRPVTSPAHQRARAGLAFVPENRGVLFRLTVAENLRLGPGPVDAALDLFPELVPLLRQRAGLVSGGEQQMLALARAIAGGPKAVMVDELSQGLAPRVVDRLLVALRDVADRGAAALVVEQQVDRALRVADRAYVLCRGEVALHAKAGELLDRPEDLRRLYLSEVT